VEPVLYTYEYFYNIFVYKGPTLLLRFKFNRKGSWWYKIWWQWCRGSWGFVFLYWTQFGTKEVPLSLSLSLSLERQLSQSRTLIRGRIMDVNRSGPSFCVWSHMEACAPFSCTKRVFWTGVETAKSNVILSQLNSPLVDRDVYLVYLHQSI